MPALSVADRLVDRKGMQIEHLPKESFCHSGKILYANKEDLWLLVSVQYRVKRGALELEAIGPILSIY